MTITTSSVRRWRSAARPEQLAKNRNIAQNRDLRQVPGALVVQQAGDRQVLALPELHLGLGPPGPQRGDLEARDHQAVGEVQRAHFGLDLEPDRAVSGDVRGEPQPDPELLEDDRDRVASPVPWMDG